MASMTMTASLVGAANPRTNLSSVNRRSVSLVKTIRAQADLTEKNDNNNNKASNGRRELVFAAAAAAAAICGIGLGQGEAIAGEPPKRGTPEAKKYYAPVCVSNPTASVCNK